MSDEAQRAGGGDGQPNKKRRRRRRGKKPGGGGDGAPAEQSSGGEPARDERPTSGRGDGRRRRGGGGGGGGRGRGRDAAAEREPDRRHRVKTEQFSEETFDLEQSFEDLGLSGEVLQGVEHAGFKHPTHIQSDLIPVALTGKDILGQAKTGTGKTLGFGLPLLSMVQPGRAFSVLILAPTRELAIQIRQDIDEVNGFTGLKTVAVYGGQSIRVQADQLDEGPEIIVGTPGRVMDMVGRGYMCFDGVKFAVLDEVDRMFDFGFRDDMKKILSACPKDRQTIFVSATLTDEIEGLARRYMQDPEKLVVSGGSLTVDLVTQSFVSVEPWDKRRMLAHMLTHEEPALTLVFCRMKRTVDSLVRSLDKHGIDAHAIHGDLSQGQRNRVMDKFRSGKLSVLVASDLASRGIDVDGISHVVNFDLPDDPDVYVHRIGRTARAGREGTAWSLVTKEQGKLLTEIENLINAEIPEVRYDDFEPRPRPKDWKDEPKGGRPVIEIEGVDREPKNRHAETEVPVADEMDPEELAAKFPGGVVPGKRPKKMMRGRSRTRRG